MTLGFDEFHAIESFSSPNLHMVRTHNIDGEEKAYYMTMQFGTTTWRMGSKFPSCTPIWGRWPMMWRMHMRRLSNLLSQSLSAAFADQVTMFAYGVVYPYFMAGAPRSAKDSFHSHMNVIWAHLCAPWRLGQRMTRNGCMLCSMSTCWTSGATSSRWQWLLTLRWSWKRLTRIYQGRSNHPIIVVDSNFFYPKKRDLALCNNYQNSNLCIAAVHEPC